VLAIGAGVGCGTSTGTLAFVDALRGDAKSARIEDPVAIAISSDGRFAYVAASGADAVAVLERDPGTGALRPGSGVRNGIGGVDGLDQPSDLALSPDGRNLYVAGFDADALVTFARDPQRGTLRFVAVVRDRAGGGRGLGGAVSVVVSTDGKSVYVAGREDDAIGVFTRDAGNGRLRYVESKREPNFGPTSLAIAPDGRHVYASGFDASALAVYARDPVTSRLTRVVTVDDADDPAHALQNASGVAVGPDGRRVVAASYGENAVELFERDPDSGALTRIATARAGIDAPPRLRRPLGVAFDPSGEAVYAAASEPGSLIAFDIRDGTLRPAPVHHDAGMEAVAEACAVGVSPDGEDVYVAGFGHSAIARFRRAQE
jgi:6-phosphogluconolactonase (cycloisomerase 2 family)